MTVAFLPRYDRLGASSRLRFFMYFERFVQEYAHAEIKPGLSDAYLQELYSTTQTGSWRKLREMVRLFCRAVNLPENLIIEYELIPNLPWKYEKLLLRNRRYILNFDDNVWEKYRDKPSLRDKYDLLCKHAAGVIVANDFLYDKVRLLNDNIIKIPTVVKLSQYAGTVEKYPVFTAAWIGTPVTYKYLESHLITLQKMFDSNEAELLVIAKANLGVKRPLPGVNVRYADWSPELECEYLKKCHVGIMPLEDDDFSRGKSAYKLLQYQAAGLPLLASPVGENCHVVQEGVNGFLTNTPQEWQQKLQNLRTNKELYCQCSKNSAAQAYDYSFEKFYPVFKEFVLHTFRSR